MNFCLILYLISLFSSKNRYIPVISFIALNCLRFINENLDFSEFIRIEITNLTTYVIILKEPLFHIIFVHPPSTGVNPYDLNYLSACSTLLYDPNFIVSDPFLLTLYSDSDELIDGSSSSLFYPASSIA